MRAEELWKAYCEKENIDIDTPYEAWGFGDAPDQLADLELRLQLHLHMIYILWKEKKIHYHSQVIIVLF